MNKFIKIHDCFANILCCRTHNASEVLRLFCAGRWEIIAVPSSSHWNSGETHINSHKPHYIIYRLESLCKSDLAKVRLRLGNSAAASFQLNSSLVPGRVFNCHLELALDSSKLGKKLKQQSGENTNVGSIRPTF